MGRITIKLTEAQVNSLLNEDYPFSYLGTESSDMNHGEDISCEGPRMDAPECDPTPVTGDEIGHTITNSSWWNRAYGRTSGYVGNMFESNKKTRK